MPITQSTIRAKQFGLSRRISIVLFYSRFPISITELVEVKHVKRALHGTQKSEQVT